MELVNELTGHASEPGARFAAETAVALVQPYAPHLAEELWARLGHTTPAHAAPWPVADPAMLTADTFELVLQVNGKVRDRVEAPVGISKDEALALARASEKMQVHLAGMTVRKEIVVPGKLVNIVVG
jgi:leucyl-tRNA synthetase